MAGTSVDVGGGRGGGGLSELRGAERCCG